MAVHERTWNSAVWVNIGKRLFLDILKLDAFNLVRETEFLEDHDNLPVINLGSIQNDRNMRPATNLPGVGPRS